MTLPRPLEGRYGVMLAIAILALAPFVVVTTAYTLYSRQVGHDLGASRTALEIIAGEATAGYAFGALLGGDLIQRFRQRHLFLLCETLFVLGCIAAAAAGGVALYAAGRVLMGFATGLLLVIALPPVIQNFPATRMPVTVVAVNIGFFGAVCAGPLLGGAVEQAHAWRWFHGGLGLLGCVALLLALFTLPHRDPPNPSLRLDATALILGVAATALPFWGVGELTAHGFASFRVAVPLGVGMICFVTLLVIEYVKPDSLSPVERMWSTLPVVGTLVAMAGGGLFVAFQGLATQFQLQVAHRPPIEVGLLYWPQTAGVLITAALLGMLIRTRFLPLLILGGMAVTVGGGALLFALSPHGPDAAMLAATGLLGLGAGATVSPGLYLAGFALRARLIGRIFALVELVRSVSDYILAPVILRIARDASHGSLTMHGITHALWLLLLLSVALVALGVALYLAGGVGLPKPDLQGWIESDRAAVKSPPLLALFRRR